jgi:iron complex outermembrane receptor protein
MDRRIYRRLLLTTASLGAALASHAAAQTNSVTEVVVTARRVSERLQDVPISITVVDADTLSKANIVSSTDLAKVVPGLSVQSLYSSDMSTFAIRGFYQESRTSATVGVYFADVVTPRGGGTSIPGGDGAGAANMMDLQNVQVLKGPQGTLFGRNTTGGAILLVPKKPTDKFEGYVEGSVGNYNMRRVQAVVNLPLSDVARLRLDVDRMKQDGWVRNVSGIGPSRFNDADHTALRGSLVLNLTPELENYTIASWYNSDHMPSMQQLFTANPNAGLGGLAAPQVNRLNASGDFYQVETFLPNPRAFTRQWQIINTTTWHASEALTVKNITSYSQFRQILRDDIFSTNFPLSLGGPRVGSIVTSVAFAPDGADTNAQNNISEELQFQGKAVNERLNWQAGLYYENSYPAGFIQSFGPSIGALCSLQPFTAVLNIQCLPPGAQTGTGTATLYTVKASFLNLGAYAQATYALSDKLKLTAGLRYTNDLSKGAVLQQRYTFVATTPNPFAFTTVSPNFTCPIGYPAPDCRINSRAHSAKPTWTLNAAYNITPGQMVYGTYARGYRQGGVQPLGAPSNQTFQPETLDDFEVGAKTTFHGAISGRFNVAAYYERLKNQQINFGLLSTTTGAFGTSIFNAGRSRMYGVEMDTSLVLTDWLRVDAAGGYLNSKLISIAPQGPFPQFNVVNPSAAAGDPLPYSPKWSGTITAAVTLPLPESVGKVEADASYRYQAAFATAASTVSSLKTTEVKQVDLSLDWRNVAGKPVDVSLFGTNVTNQNTAVLLQPLFNSFGFDGRYLGPPRMYGVRVRARFG